jgi:hypothetical protein
LAGRYARKAIPDRFGQLAIRGRNPRGQTVKGWPDAYVTREDGTIDALEATRDTRNWRVHLAGDLDKAEKTRIRVSVGSSS